jgi:hypothetical protein
MAESWKVAPPYRNWLDYAPSLGEYAAKRTRETKAPTSEGMPAWFKKNAAALRADPYLRDRNNVVAVHLVEMLKRDPDRWDAFRYLNLGRPDPLNSFEAFIENWYFSVPAAHKKFVKDVAELLGVKSQLIADHASK